VRQFGFLFCVIGALLAGYLAYKGSPVWPWCAGAAVVFAAAGMFAYPVLRPVYVGWMMFAFALGWVNSRILLGLFYYLVLTPIGLFLRITGKDLLDKKIDRSARSYWVKREKAPFDPKQLERMF